ncbi:iron/ascorbate-dependent oxidoreductase family protein [Abortiporus biennis]
MSSINVPVAHSTPGGIKVVDFSPFIDGSEAGEAIVSSFKETGFVYLVNHGLGQDKIDQMFNWSQKFFTLPLELKQLAPHPADGSHHRGYSAPGVEKVRHMGSESATDKPKTTTSLDVKESFEVGRENDLAMPNILLPEGVLPGFNEACLDFFWTCFETAKQVFRALAVGFHLEEDYFLKYHTRPDNQLRLLHYPSVSTQKLNEDEIVRIGAHSDFCSLTLLMQDEVGGLEVEDPKNPGKFQSAPPINRAIIVNAGDFLMRWSNDTIRSTIHRVRAPPGLTTKDGMTPERYSIPYFCAADFDKVVDCVPGTFGPENPKKYKPISSGEYIKERLAFNY